MLFEVYTLKIIAMNKVFIFFLLFLAFSSQAQDTLSIEKDKTNELKSSAVSSRKIKSTTLDIDIENSNQFSFAVQVANDINLEANTNRSRRSSSKNEQKVLKEVVEVMKDLDENSFEYNYYKYITGNYDVSLFSFLQKASNLRPKSSEVQTQLAAYYLIMENYEQAEFYINTLFENQIISTSLIDYGQDLLVSVPENGTLITHGIEDTYSVTFLQLNMGVRSDVEIISLELMQSEMYRNHLKEKGFKFPLSDFIDVNYYTEFCALNEEKNISTSLTVPREYFQFSPQKQFLTGLVMHYSSNRLDNVGVNMNLWKYELKYLILDNSNDVKSKELSSNYLPMLFQLRQVYHLMEDIQGIEEIDKLLDRIGLFSGKVEKVQSLKARY